MTAEEIKAYAEQMIAVCEKGGALEPHLRMNVVIAAMHTCGPPSTPPVTSSTGTHGSGPIPYLREIMPTEKDFERWRAIASDAGTTVLVIIFEVFVCAVVVHYLWGWVKAWTW